MPRDKSKNLLRRFRISPTGKATTYGINRINNTFVKQTSLLIPVRATIGGQTRTILSIDQSVTDTASVRAPLVRDAQFDRLFGDRPVRNDDVDFQILDKLIDKDIAQDRLDVLQATRKFEASITKKVQRVETELAQTSKDIVATDKQQKSIIFGASFGLVTAVSGQTTRFVLEAAGEITGKRRSAAIGSAGLGLVSKVGTVTAAAIVNPVLGILAATNMAFGILKEQSLQSIRIQKENTRRAYTRSLAVYENSNKRSG